MFVFASATETNPNKIIDKYLKDVDYEVKYLHSGKKEKDSEKDIDLDMDSIDGYKVLALVGAEPLKYIAGMTGIQKNTTVCLLRKSIFQL